MLPVVPHYMKTNLLGFIPCKQEVLHVLVFFYLFFPPSLSKFCSRSCVGCLRASFTTCRRKRSNSSSILATLPQAAVSSRHSTHTITIHTPCSGALHLFTLPVSMSENCMINPCCIIQFSRLHGS